MYTDEKRRGSLIKDFILKLILIIIFVLLLIWLVPWPNMDSLNPLKDQIFNSNLQTMKEAGITYFTTERLPVEVGDKTTLTLQKMLDMKLIIPFTDKNGNTCDVKKSYVSLEKKETEYLMKVNLKCGEEEDYILVHLGCYSYCTTDICEKQNEDDVQVVKPTTKPTSTTKPTKKPTPTATAKPTVTPTVVPTPTPTVIPEEKECQWKKETTAQYSTWSDWTKVKGKANSENTDVKEVVDLGTVYEQTGIKAAVYQKIVRVKEVKEQAGTYKYKVCTNYEYAYDSEHIARIDSDWEYVDQWYQGYNPPADTLTERWIFQGVNFDQCDDDCTNHPYTIYRKQTRHVTIYTENSNVTAECTDIEEREIPIYITRKKSFIDKIEIEPAKAIFDYVSYYKYRTRTLLTAASVDYKWVDCDQSLTAEGYTATEKTRTK